ncbi:MAG: hypothetical protein AAF253_04240 [Pseudomonadota bacterium]
MIESSIETGDVDVLANILENEKRHHCRIRSICFGLFVFSFVLLLGAMATIAYLFANSSGGGSSGIWLTLMQILAPISAAMVGFFASWCAAHNCVNSIDRSLYAARAGRMKLFAGFVSQLQCASKSKRSIWMDMIGSVVG